MGQELLWIACLIFKMLRSISKAPVCTQYDASLSEGLLQKWTVSSLLFTLWNYATVFTAMEPKNSCLSDSGFFILEVSIFFFPLVGFHQGSNVARQLMEDYIIFKESVSSLSLFFKLCHWLRTSVTTQSGNSRNSAFKLLIFPVFIFVISRHWLLWLLTIVYPTCIPYSSNPFAFSYVIRDIYDIFDLRKKMGNIGKCFKEQVSKYKGKY